ncbi:hypothetical protein [Nonomuraea dietziae]|uniref:hypothetical protein n=1 Tax=Nonomuraea dietziae TaxID=65515 RepID=UPI0031CEEA3A
MDENDAYIDLPSGAELLFGQIVVWTVLLLPTAIFLIWVASVMARRSKQSLRRGASGSRMIATSSRRSAAGVEA